MEKKIQTIIADDNNTNRQDLKNILLEYEEIEIVGETSNGVEALELIKEQNPKVIFLDIKMPEMDGLSVAKEIASWNSNIIVIFITGFNEYALKAFEVGAADYISKPFRKPRIDKTIKNIKSKLSELNVNNINSLLASNTSEKLLIKTKHEINFINIDSICFIERSKFTRKSIIHTTNNKYQTYENLISLQTRINKNHFFRSHKSYLINLKRVQKITPWGQNGFLVTFFDNDSDAYISKNKAHDLFQMLKQQDVLV